MSLHIRIDTANIRNALGRFQTFTPVLQARLMGEFKHELSNLKEIAQEASPDGKQEYYGDSHAGEAKIKDSWEGEVNAGSGFGNIEVMLFNTSPHANLFLGGTAAHIIMGNPLLHFYWQSQGVTFGGPVVNHPGSEPNQEVIDQLENYINGVIVPGIYDTINATIRDVFISFV